MKRIVSVWLPNWPITVWSKAAGRSPPPEAQPFALVHPGPRGMALTAVNAQARRLGLSPGQPHADARAAVPDLVSPPAEPLAEAAALQTLALWAERYSPLVAIDAGPPGLEGLTLDMTGGTHLFGGEAGLLDDLVRRLAAAGVSAQAALADTPGAAWALARFAAPSTIAPPGEASAALAPLPVSALRLEPDDVRLLRRLGLRRIGDLAAMPRAGLARRFPGAAGLGVVRRLDQALGLAAEPLPAVRPAPRHRVWRTFVEPVIDVAGAEAVLGDLAPELAADLVKHGHGAVRLCLTGFRVDGRATLLAVGLGAPSAKSAHFVRVLRDRGLERLDFGFGVDALMLSAEATEPLATGQNSLDGQGEAEHADAFTDLVDRIGARLGRRAVYRLSPRSSWLPERSERRVRPEATGDAPPSAIGGERPLLLLRPPEPVSVIAEVPDGPPVQFTWRRVAARVARAQGPERLSPEWWRPKAAGRLARTRDYYKVEDTEGRRFWLFREGLYVREDKDNPPSWWMHGLFP